VASGLLAVTHDTDMRMQEIAAASTAYSCFAAMKVFGHCSMDRNVGR
jgi:hypothetical protein